MSEKHIDVVFSLVDNFSKNFEKSIAALTNGSKSAQNAWKKVGQAGESIASVGAGLSAAVTAPLVGIGVTATREFGEVDKSMKLVQATMGDAAWATGDLTSAMKEAAANSTFGMQDAADAALNFARQGFNAAQASDMLAPSMALASGTATDLSEVTGGLGNALKMFGAESNEASRYADILARAQASANTTTSDLFEAMSEAGPVVNSVGWSISDLSTITGIFGNAGISGAEGANALKTGIARLASPAKDGSVWMEKLGVNVFDSHGKMKDMLTVQKDLHNAFTGLSDSEKMSAASAIFGKNQMAKWMTLIEASPADFQKLSSSIDNSAGSAQSMSDALMSGVGGSFEKLSSSFDVFKYNVGQTVGTVIQPYVDKVTELIDKFNSLSPAQQRHIEKMALMAAAAGPVLLGFGKLVSGISKVGVFVNGLMLAGSKLGGVFATAGAGGKLFGGILAAITSPAAIVIAVLAGIAIVAVLVWKNWDKIAAVFEKAKTKLQPIINLFRAVGRAIQAVVKAVTNFASGFAAGFSRTANATGLTSGLKSGLDSIRKAMEPILPFIKKLIPILTSAFNKAADFLRKHSPQIRAFGKTVGEVVGKIATVVGTVLGGAFTIAGKVIGAAITTIIAVVKGLITVIKPIINGVKQVFGGIVKFITGVFAGDWEKAWQGVVDIFSGIFETLTGIAKSVINGVSGAINAVIGAINRMGFTIPDWVPVIGGKSFSVNIPTIPTLAKGTDNWKGGIAQVSERGGEIIDLPRGSRVYPHDASVQMARRDTERPNITIAKLADSIVVREEADIDRIGNMLVRKIMAASSNMGTVPVGG